MPDAVKQVVITDDREEIKRKNIRTTVFRILSWPLPFFWLAKLFAYLQWANRKQRREAMLFMSGFAVLILAATMAWLRLVFYSDGINWQDVKFYLAVGIAFNLLMNTLASRALVVPDRTTMTLRDEPRLSYLEVADSTPNKIVLGATGSGYTKIDWFSDFNRKHLMLYADTDGTGARDYLIYLAWCASAYKKTLLVFCDSGKGSAADFPAALQSDEVVILNTSTQINKFFSWLRDEFKERYKKRRSGIIPDIRIVIIFDDQTADNLIFQKGDNPTLRAINGHAQEIIMDGKSQNIHLIALAPASRRPADLPAEVYPSFESLLFYYRLRYRVSAAQQAETGNAFETEESPVATFDGTYVGKILDTFVIWRNRWIRCRAPYIPDVQAGKEISANLKTTDDPTNKFRRSAEDFESYEAQQIETFFSRYSEKTDGGLKLNKN